MTPIKETIAKKDRISIAICFMLAPERVPEKINNRRPHPIRMIIERLIPHRKDAIHRKICGRRSIEISRSCVRPKIHIESSSAAVAKQMNLFQYCRWK